MRQPPCSTLVKAASRRSQRRGQSHQPGPRRRTRGPWCCRCSRTRKQAKTCFTPSAARQASRTGLAAKFSCGSPSPPHAVVSGGPPLSQAVTLVELLHRNDHGVVHRRSRRTPPPRGVGQPLGQGLGEGLQRAVHEVLRKRGQVSSSKGVTSPRRTARSVGGSSPGRWRTLGGRDGGRRLPRHGGGRRGLWPLQGLRLTGARQAGVVTRGALPRGTPRP